MKLCIILSFYKLMQSHLQNTERGAFDHLWEFYQLKLEIIPQT